MSLPSHIRLRHSARAKRVALRLDPVERVFDLVVPKGMSAKKAQIFAEAHEGWMREKLCALPDKVGFHDGAVIPVLGLDTLIRYHIEPDLRVTKIVLEDGVLHVRTNKGDATSRILRFLKALIKDELELLSYEKSARIDKSVQSVSVRDTKTRWGSCSRDGNLSYSWRLIFAPHCAFDYVVAHEVAHLKHLDHSKRFWDVCESLSEDYDGGKGWMKDNSAELMRYG